VQCTWHIWNKVVVYDGWKHIQVYTKSNPRSWSRMYIHKCKKVESKTFHRGAKYWIYNMLYTKFEIFYVLKLGQNYFWNWLVELY
jgi:hypothetical protein